MIKNKILSILLIMCFLCLTPCQAAFAAETNCPNDDKEINIVKTDNLVQINVDDESFSFNLNTGELKDTHGKLVGRVLQDIVSVYSTNAEKPVAIQHGISVASRWLYGGSSWESAELFERSENIAVGLFASMLIAFGLEEFALSTAGKIILSSLGATAISDWNSTHSNLKSYHIYVRKYLYGNRNVLSDFAYVWQGYLEDYVPSDVIRSTYGLTF